MNIEYAPRARADLLHIGAQSRRVFGEGVAGALEAHIRATVARLALISEREHLKQRPTVYSLPLVRYTFRIFYELTEETVIILHIRHTSRRGWADGKRYLRNERYEKDQEEGYCERCGSNTVTSSLILAELI